MVIFRSFTFYLAIAGLILAFVLINKITTPPPAAERLVEPASTPYHKTIAASGIIEAVDKNIEVGVPLSGLVKEVHVKVWDSVEQGVPLFRMDDRELLAHLLVQKANALVALAQVKRAKDQLDRLESVNDPRAISQEELDTKRSDVAVAQAQLQAAEAQITHTMLLIERLTICAPKDGAILQCNIRKGEFVTAGSLQSAIILGNLEHLQVRADIDEQNASRVIAHTSAIAYPKNNASIEIPLRFDRIEPYVIPKRSLTGAQDERVDTRVLQVIYTFDRHPTFPLYVGQQVDVFIEQPEPTDTVEENAINAF